MVRSNIGPFRNGFGDVVYARGSGGEHSLTLGVTNVGERVAAETDIFDRLNSAAELCRLVALGPMSCKPVSRKAILTSKDGATEGLSWRASRTVST